jgi:hypothetical protein
LQFGVIGAVVVGWFEHKAAKLADWIALIR